MKKVLVVGGVIIALIAAGFIGMRIYTKSFSPSGLSEYTYEGVDIKVTYGRPYKKDRVIFGGLVPYGQVWRTGANESTVFTTNTDLLIGEELLPKGTYSIFTIPNQESWEIIFNTTIPSWGVKIPSGKAARNSDTDALQVEVSVINTQNVFEQFTIDFETLHDEIDMVIMWDQTLVVIPITPKN